MTISVKEVYLALNVREQNSFQLYSLIKGSGRGSLWVSAPEYPDHCYRLVLQTRAIGLYLHRMLFSSKLL